MFIACIYVRTRDDENLTGPNQCDQSRPEETAVDCSCAEVLVLALVRVLVGDIGLDVVF